VPQFDKVKLPPRPKILLIKLRSIGDVIYNTAVYTPLKRCFPDAHLTVLVERPSYDLVRNHPDVDEVLCFRKGSFLAAKILGQTNYKIILGGGPGEKQHIRAMREKLDPGQCHDSIGIPLKPDSCIIGQARLLITCDTGPMHVGFALKVPTVALFGPYDPRGTGPFDLKKNNCFMIHPTVLGEFSPETDFEGGDLKKIGVERVWDKVQEALAHSPDRLQPDVKKR